MAVTHPLSFQLYSARNFPPLEAQVATLAGLGYTNVESFGGVHGDPAGLHDLLGRHGMSARSGHFPLDLVAGDTLRVIEIARTLGMDLVVVPYLAADQRPADGPGWKAFGRRLAELAGRLAPHRLRFAWHNHDFEFRPLADGSYPIEHILADGVLWEADLAWIAKAGEDPSWWLKLYAGRVPAIHVKDIAPEGENMDEDGWADVGTGRLAWAQLWREAVEAGAELMVAEHDNPSDFARFARVSAASMRAMASNSR